MLNNIENILIQKINEEKMKNIKTHHYQDPNKI